MDMFYQNVSKKCPSLHRAPAPKKLTQPILTSSETNAGFSRMAKEEEEPEEEELRWIEGTRFESRPLQLFLLHILYIYTDIMLF